MLNGVMFRTVRRVMSHSDFQFQPVRQRLQILLEKMTIGTVAAAPVAQDQQPPGFRVGLAALFVPPQFQAVAAQFAGVVRRVQVDAGRLTGHVVNPVRDQRALAERAEIVVEGFFRMLRECRAGPVKIAQKLLLLGVDADHRIARLSIRLPQCSDVFELGVAVRMVAHAFLLASRSAAQAKLSQHSADGSTTGRRVHGRQASANLAYREVRPEHALPHGVTGREFLKNLA